MARTLAEAYVRARLDTTGIGAEAEKAGKTAGGRLHSGVMGSMKGLAAGIAGTFATIGAISFFKSMIVEAKESVLAGNLTAAAIKSTGGAAKITAGQVSDLATALSNKVGVDDELIQSGENLLLTFTRVRNEAGKGNDIFNQASGAIVDMTAAMNGGTVSQEGLKASTIQVGKALNDPIKGITALSRVGVTFSAQQKEQIANFVKSGNIMAAQKVILAELRTEFGGAAAAAATPAQKAAVAWGNFKELLGGFVLPLVGRLADLFTGRLLPILQDKVVPFVRLAGGAFVAAFREGDITSGGFIGTLQRLGGILGMVWHQAQAFWVGMTQGADTDAGVMQQLGNVVRTYLIPAITTLVGWLSTAVGWFTGGSQWAGLLRAAIAGAAGAILIAAGVIKIITTAQMLWNLAMALNPIGLVIIAIGALVAGVIYAWTHFAGFRNVVIAVWEALKTGALAVWAVLQPIFQAIGTAVLWLWQHVIYPSFKGWELLFRDVIGPVVLWLWHNIIEPAMAGIKLVIDIVWAAVRIAFGLVEIQVRAMAVVFGWLWHNIVEPYFRGMFYVISQVWDGVKQIFGFFGSFLKDHVAPTFKQGVDLIAAWWNGIKEVAAAPVRFVVETVINRGIIAGWNWLHDHLHVGDSIKPIGIPFAEGGPIRGPGTGTSDSIWARIPGGPFLKVSSGEYIVRAAAVDALGVPFLDSINAVGGARRAKYPGDGSAGLAFAEGGFLGALGDIWSVISDPVKAIAAPIRAAIGRTPGSGPFRDMVTGVGGRAVDGLVQAINNLFVGVSGAVGGVVGGVNLAIARNLLLAAVGKPYGWAQAGPGSFDCSGIVSMVWNVLHGRSPYNHTFSTMNEAPFFPIPGVGGVLSAGWTNPGEPGPGGSSVGHTAGLLAGILPFESTGGVGVRVGPGVTSIGRFAHIGHFDIGGPWPSGVLGINTSGRTEHVASGDTMDEIADLLRALIAAVERVAPGVGSAINGASRRTVQTLRAR